GPAGPIDRAVQAWRARLVGTAERGAGEAPERAVRRLVWEPVEAHLAGCPAVLVIPDAGLTAVPWAALPGKKSGSYLREEYALGTASHGKQLYQLLTQKTAPADKLLVVGGVHYDAGPARLPGPPAVAQRGPARDGKVRQDWRFLPGSLKEAEDI